MGAVEQLRALADKLDAEPIGASAYAPEHAQLRLEALRLAAKEGGMRPVLDVARDYARFLIEGC
jgi:hypothetical protein